jgi:hypothetical protein
LNPGRRAASADLIESRDAASVQSGCCITAKFGAKYIHSLPPLQTLSRESLSFPDSTARVAYRSQGHPDDRRRKQGPISLFCAPNQKHKTQSRDIYASFCLRPIGRIAMTHHQLPIGIRNLTCVGQCYLGPVIIDIAERAREVTEHVVTHESQFHTTPGIVPFCSLITTLPEACLLSNMF